MSPPPLARALSVAHWMWAGVSLLGALSAAGWWILVVVVGDRATSGGRDRALQAADAWGQVAPWVFVAAIVLGLTSAGLCALAARDLARGAARGRWIGIGHAAGALAVGLGTIALGLDGAVSGALGLVLPVGALVGLGLLRPT